MKNWHKTGIKCRANTWTGEGEFQILDQFHSLDPLMKVDLVGDWYHDIEELYDEVKEDWREHLMSLKGTTG